MLSNAFKKNENFQECSLKALVHKREPQVGCVSCNKMFLIDEVTEKMGCPDCGKDDFEISLKEEGNERA